MAKTRRSFGAIEKRPGGYRASYIGPDGRRHRRRGQFIAKEDAEGWLLNRKREIDAGTWEPPEETEARQAAEQRSIVRFGDFADNWLTHRDLTPRTRRLYAGILTNQLLPAFGDLAIKAIDTGIVRNWYNQLDPGRPTRRSHAYSLLRAILNDAVRDELIDRNPCVISGAGSAKSRRQITPLSPAELHALADAMPAKHKAAVLISGWCALRYGEVTELRRRDIDTKAGTVRVERAVTRVDGKYIVGKPKSDAGVRTVAMPPHIVDDIKTHLRLYTQWGRDGLLFPAKNGGHIDSSSMFGQPARQVKSKRTGKTYNKPAWGFHRAREAIGRPDLRWHDLRHTGATLAAVSGASLRELQARLGHSTTQAAMVYQHVADGRDAEIAAKLSDMWEATR